MQMILLLKMGVSMTLSTARQEVINLSCKLCLTPIKNAAQSCVP